MSRRVLQAFGGSAGDVPGALALSVQRILETCGTSISRAWCTIAAGEPRVVIQRLFKDPASGTTRRSLQTFSFEPINGIWSSSGSPVPLATNVISVAPSPSGTKLAIVRSDSPEPSKSKITVELWCCASGALLRSIVADETTFGNPLSADGTLSEGLSWSQCERFTAFVCATPSPPSSSSTTSGGGVFASLQPSVRASLLDRSTVSSSSSTTTTPNEVPPIAKETVIAGKNSEFREDFGEKFVGISSTRIAIIDWDIGTVRALQGSPTASVVASGTPIFTTTTNGILSIIYVGFTTTPRRLGLAACNNRQTQLFLAPVSNSTEEHITLTPSHLYVRSPRVSPNGSFVAFLATSDAGKTFHSASAELGIIDFTNNNKITMHASGGASSPILYEGLEKSWKGIYAPSLPLSPWSPDSKSLFVNTQQNSRNMIIRVYIDGNINAEPFAPNLFPWAKSYNQTSGPKASSSFCGALQINAGGDILYLVTSSSPTTPENFAFVWANKSSSSWQAVPGPELRTLPYLPSSHTTKVIESASDSLRELNFRIIETYPTAVETSFNDSSKMVLPFESILIWSKEAEKAVKEKGLPGLPLLVIPHGGPHAAFSTVMVASHAVYASLGYAVLLVNYRGSTGYGDAELTSLPKNAGLADCSDVFQATIHALSLGGSVLASTSCAMNDLNTKSGVAGDIPRFDEKRVAVIGGSHGGYIGAHLISNPGTRPLFRAAVLRNPVTNIASMLSATDIPEWCWATVFGDTVFLKADGTRNIRLPTLTREKRAAMFDASPMSRISHVRLRGENHPVSEIPMSGGKLDVVVQGAKCTEITDSSDVNQVASHAARISSLDAGAALLLMLGGKDRRVPPSQGMEFYYALRERNTTSNDALKVLVYENDGHALDGAATESEALLASLEFIEKWV